MPSATGKTTKPARSKAAKIAAASVSHREETMAWLSKSPKNAAAYLDAALETGDPGDFMAALRLVTEATGGVTKLAERTGLNREALYRTLSPRGNPQLSSLMPILAASGLKIAVAPMQRAK